MTDKMREEFESWAFQCPWLGLSDECMARDEINGGYYGLELHAAWLAWQAARLPAGVVSATAWRVVDAKGKRFTVYNKDLAMAISDAGLHVAPMCDVPPEGWECSRVSGHEGPCAAFEVKP